MPNRRRPGDDKPQRPAKKRGRRWLVYTLLIMLGLFFGVSGAAAAFVYKAYQSLPAYEDFDPSQSSVILDNQETIVYRLADQEDRTVIKDLSEIPKPVQDAFIATEDHRFREHKGIDLWRLGGAVWSDIKYYLGVKGSQLEGGSTITMQLARNAFLTLDQTLTRKVQEMMIALQLERRFTKDEILLRYLNQVSFGYQAAGLEAAANRYFSKSAKDLTLSEAAMLAGILKGPSQYNPLDNFEGAMERRNIVLDLMVEHGYLDRAEADSIKAEAVTLNPAKITATTVAFTGDWYVDYVINILTNADLAAKYGTPVFDAKDLYSRGLKIYTALDQGYQKIIEEKVPPALAAGTKQYGGTDVPQAAVVIMEPKSGEVRAIYGGTQHTGMLEFNRATDSYRQPGSSIKPIVSYLPAIDLLGWGPATVIDDSPLMLSNDRSTVWPANYEFRYLGLLPMRFGLEQSINAMAVRAIQAVTPGKAIDYAWKMGLTTIQKATADGQNANDEHLALALGGLTQGVTPLDMTAAYAVLANLGERVSPVVITKIEDKHGDVIFQAPRIREQVIRKESVWLMVDIMKGSITRGTASYSAQGWHGWPAAGKTGTTENWQDAWFIGFTPELVTGVWTGYDNNEGEMRRLPGTQGYSWTGAGPPTVIWREIMDAIYDGKPPADWQRPAGLTMVEVCKTSGLLPGPNCPKEDIVSDWFRTGFEPKQVDNVWTMVQVVKQPWQPEGAKTAVDRYFLWQAGCGLPETRLMIKRPTTYAKHPTDPYNFDRYWPKDWIDEVPTEVCTPTKLPILGDPLSPLLPSDPNQPANPNQPGNPNQPSNPNQPANPTQPANPNQPPNPNKPANPTQPAQQGQTGGGNPPTQNSGTGAQGGSGSNQSPLDLLAPLLIIP